MTENTSQTSSSIPAKRPSPETEDPSVSFKVTYGKTSYSLEFPLKSSTVRDLKLKLQELSGIDPVMQKLLYKGVLKDESTLEQAKINSSAKIIMMASSAQDILKVATASVASTPVKETEKQMADPNLQELPQHKKIIAKGKPEGGTIGIMNCNDPLPASGISDLWNSYGSKTRLTFKFELSQLWIGTNERTVKVNLDSIQKVYSEGIKGMEEYHMMALQLGPTEK